MTDLDQHHPQSAASIQLVFDDAYEAGILDEPRVHDPADGITAAWIDKGELHETVSPRRVEDRR